MTNCEAIKSQIKLDLIEYYDIVKNEIDIKAQKLLLELDNIPDSNDIDFLNQIDCKKKKILKINDQFIKNVDQILDSNMIEINNFFLDHSNNLCQCRAANKEEIKLDLLKNYCIFVSNDYLKSELKDSYLVGVLLITDWYLNKNEVQYLKVKFEDNDIKRQIRFSYDEIHTFYINQRSPSNNTNQKEQIKEIKFNLDQNVLNIMYAFGAFGDSTKNLIHQQDNIFKLKKKDILDDLSTLSKFYLNFEKYFTKSIELERIEENTFVNLKNLNELYLRCKSFDQNVFNGMNKLKVLKLNYYNDDLKLGNKFNYNNNNQTVATSSTTEIISINKQVNQNNFIFYEFKHLNDLRLLELSHANINILKENSFYDLTNLELLILYRCSITHIEPRAFANLNHLKKLDMQHNNIEKLESKIFDGLVNLKELILNYCGIKYIEPNAFASLQNLVILIIKNNELNYLKENTFNGLFNLKVLNISNYNESIKIFEENVFKDLKNLRTLEISDMEIDEIKLENLNDLINLEELFCYGCSIKSINQNAFKNSSNLKVLNLSYNNIDIIKEYAFQGLINLEELDLSESNIRKVEDNVFNGLNSLINLDLAKTQIFSFGFGHEEIFDNLEIKNNKFEGIFRSVQVLDLSFNNFDCIDESFFKNFSNLNKLIISLHELNIFKLRKFDGLANLDELIVLFSNDIQPIFDEDHFKNFTNLKKLVLSLESYYSCIQLIDQHTFEGLKHLKNLELLDLSKGWICHIEPYSFKNFPNLKHLNLSFNNIEIIKENAFKGLDNLEILDLSNCKIEHIEPNGFNGLSSKLEKLDLQCNPIQITSNQEFKYSHGLSNQVKILYDTAMTFY